MKFCSQERSNIYHDFNPNNWSILNCCKCLQCCWMFFGQLSSDRNGWAIYFGAVRFSSWGGNSRWESRSTLLGTIVWIEVPVLLYKVYLPEFAIQLLNNLHAHFIAFFFLASAVARQLLCLELYLASPIPFDHSQMTSFVTVRIWCSFMFLLIHVSHLFLSQY